jgi:hypothetical protein
MLLALLGVVGFFALATLTAIFVSAHREALERVRKKKAQQIKQRLHDDAIAS